ncbi:IPT/TIG domain-containing protein [Flagellimonas algicola]|nr:IPT/TIG domain-containing protein [Allomuricauda algicola]
MRLFCAFFLMGVLMDHVWFCVSGPGGWVWANESVAGYSPSGAGDMKEGAPKLFSVCPLMGPKRTAVVIEGRNFGSDPDMVEVRFNGTRAEVQSVSGARITTEVPARAFTGVLTVKVGGIWLLGPEFEYEVSEVKVSTFAGRPDHGGFDGSFRNGIGKEAGFDRPRDLARDSKGNLFVADFGNHAIRKIGPNGRVSTFAGNGVAGDADGLGVRARFKFPQGLTIDGADNIYVADTGNHAIKRIDPSGRVATIAGRAQGYRDGKGPDARFDYPSGIAMGGQNDLYVSETRSHTIRRISLDDFEVTTYAGSKWRHSGTANGNLKTARFRFPSGLAMDDNGNLLVADTYNDMVRAIDLSAGTVRTLAGGDRNSDVKKTKPPMFYCPRGVAVDKQGIVSMTDTKNQCIRRIDLEGRIVTIAGVPNSKGYKDGQGSEAKFSNPYGILNYDQGEIYVADTDNHAIRKITID